MSLPVCCSFFVSSSNVAIPDPSTLFDTDQDEWTAHDIVGDEVMVVGRFTYSERSTSTECCPILRRYEVVSDIYTA